MTQDEYPLAPEHVRYVGDPVAAVIAKDEQTAFEALDLIDVKYKPLATIATPEEALATPEPRIHDYGEQGNIHRLQAFEFGDVDEALAQRRPRLRGPVLLRGQHASADRAARRGRGAGRRRQAHALVEHAGAALRAPLLARVLRVPAAHIRVIATPNGGGFGGKCDLCNHEIVVAQGGADARPPGEDLPDARGSVLHAPRPPSGADEDSAPA